MPLLQSPPPAPPATVHLIGICGTAMGAFAGMLKDQGYTVTGSDVGAYPPMSDYLAGLGIDIMQGFKASNLDHRPDLVVVGNVVRAEYEEAQALLSSDLPYTSMPALLGSRFLEPTHSVVVAGTHGKTTTTAVTAWLFDSAGRDPGFLIGGVAANFTRTARAGAGRYFVIEGDEYDTAFFDKQPKFMHYHPNTAILTSVEFDHADIYRDLDHVKEAFRAFVASIPEDGHLIARWDDPNVRDVCAAARCKVHRYGPSQEFDGEITEVCTRTGTMQFVVRRGSAVLGAFSSQLVGEHNLYNQVAAAAVAHLHGITKPALIEGFASFAGIKRRQQVIGEPGQVTVLDDFAHHPTAVRLTLQALRQRFGQRRLWAIFEPRSATSRRAIFQQAYAQAFSEADEVVIAQPYDTSRIDEDARFSSGALVADLCAQGVNAITLPAVSDIVTTVAARAHPHDVIAVLSNGGFDGLHAKLVAQLDARFSAPPSVRDQ